MKAICTICSQKKIIDPEPLPAWKRYQSPRILHVRNEANRLYIPFFLLSGKFGLIPEDQSIGFYDHMLVANESPSLTHLIKVQIKENAISELHFYAKPKDEKWGPYYDAIELATRETNTPLFIHEI